MPYLVWELVRMRFEWQGKRSKVLKNPYIDDLSTQRMVVWPGHILAKLFSRFYTPLQNDFWLWLTDRIARNLQHFFATILGGSSGPIASLKYFSSFWTWDLTEILRDFINRVFIELGERRKENSSFLWLKKKKSVSIFILLLKNVIKLENLQTGILCIFSRGNIPFPGLLQVFILLQSVWFLSLL